MKVGNIKVTGMEGTVAMEEYVGKRLGALERLLKNDSSAVLSVEMGKSTRHHHKGPYFFAELTLKLGSRTMRAEEYEVDLYAAVDKAQADIKRQVVEFKGKMTDRRKKAVRADKV